MSEDHQMAPADSLFESNFSDQPLAAESAVVGGNSSIKNNNGSGAVGDGSPIAGDEDISKTQLTLRALVTSKEAGVIIGKAGKNVADLRDQTGVKAGVSKPVPGVADRVLSVTGVLDGIAKAYAMAARTLVDSPPLGGNYVHGLSPPPPPGIATIRLLISHQQMGTVIGRQGLKIKSIQENSKVRMVASKEMLPQSTERIVEVQGTPDAIRSAVWEIGKCLIEDWERAAGTIPYNPQARNNSLSSSYNGGGNGYGGSSSRYRGGNTNGNGGPGGPDDQADGKENYQEIAISSDMVGCIIGKGGTKIQEIRRISGAKISIAKQPHDASGDRMFTIRGTPEANEKALYMLYEQLENEKNRRTQEGQN